MVETRYEPFETHLGDPETFADGPPHALFARMREDAPVMWTTAPAWWPEEDQPGFWNVTRAEDVERVSKDPETFSSALGGFTMRAGEVGSIEVQRSVMIGKDGAEHSRMRGTVNKAFTPWRVRDLEDELRARVAELIEAVAGAGRCDLAADLAGPLANATVCGLLGVPEEDREQLNRWTDAFLSSDDEVAGGMSGDEAMLASAQYLAGLMQQRRDQPADDLITALGVATYEGRPMPADEQVGVFSQLFAAGIDSTKGTICNGVLTLLEHPEQLALLREDASLIPGAVEEILRWTPAFTHQRRTATRDVELGGQAIRAGDSVVVWLQSSSRDPRAIDDPDRFDVTRGRKRCPHHAFGGGGRHFCLGAGLARLELTVFFEELLARVDDLRLAGTPERIRSGFVDGFKHVPLTFTPVRHPHVAA
ncbi:putative cytochrome P450 hydroxylase [Patulibacter medicamentivorans]|uniref:Putative cytochrome P450 hydroxylase n=1 Tax=Patulibacter medicamentivorans TaxID=1097667 RepID=H0E0A1_9ACTN|nr:cytochrome P450 [Patulibacter medicamentivorans]EHN12904.1 putative cytochrome P450 hydroxylase [Patulibacter medicamentivorans]